MITVYTSDKNAFPDSKSYIEHVLTDFYGYIEPKLFKTENGKPYVEGREVHFSLSHTKKKYFLAVAPFPVGIDAEESDRQIDDLVAKRYFPHTVFPDKKALLYRWLQTESKVKLLGSTLAKELSSPSDLTLFFSFAEREGHSLCVCAEKPSAVDFLSL